MMLMGVAPPIFKRFQDGFAGDRFQLNDNLANRVVPAVWIIRDNILLTTVTGENPVPS